MAELRTLYNSVQIQACFFRYDQRSQDRSVESILRRRVLGVGLRFAWFESNTYTI